MCGASAATSALSPTGMSVRNLSLSFLDAVAERASASSPAAPAAAAAPVIFLDIDGVLNRTRTATHIRLEPDLVARLKAIVASTHCEIVLSTFWRHFEEYIRYILHRYGISGASVIGRTPGGALRECLATDPADEAQYRNRAAEIRAWLAAHPTVTKFAILDDRGTASDEGLAAHFVQTKSDVGLTDDDVERACAILTSVDLVWP